ncbi:MAG TPA: polysaccharide biosynthesis protein [Trebonia sp.]|nr:polysaccharide biosynthesis protein [Trebonia sp.]
MSETVLEAGTAGEIIERMRRVAGPGQQRLDATTLRRLGDLTGKLAAAKPEAAAEHQRFLQVRGRRLRLPEGEVAARVGGKTILVTGGTGCIGSALLAQLAQRCPRRIVSVSRGVTGCWPRLDGADYRQADIRDAEVLARIVRAARPDVIFHVAAQRDPGLAEVEVHRTVTTNLLGTRNVLDAARKADIPQVVYASTGKALRPYSAETYTASKRACEWLMADAAATTGIRASAARFTHVADNSIVYRRLLAWATPSSAEERHDGVIRLHDPDICFYVQSAAESAQLLLAACAGAADGELRLHTISDLGLPVSLLDLALGVLGRTGSVTPVYFSGHDAGYEKAPFPGLYDPLTAGDLSPLLNAFEAASPAGSPSDMVDTARLAFAPDPRPRKHLAALEEDCARTYDPERLAGRLGELSWALLDAALRAAPRRSLERSAAQARRHWDTMTGCHRRMLAAIDDLIAR